MAGPRYAQTNLQLFAELRRVGYSTAAIEGVCAAHDLALSLFAGRYRGSGKPFVAHLTGTASILASVHARAPVVTAGLLHAAYAQGEFGDGWHGATPKARARLRSAVGPEVEDLVARYTAFGWAPSAIAGFDVRLDAMEPLEKEVLLMRLANELDDHLDLGALYCADAERRRERVRSSLLPCVNIARRLGFPDLANALSEAFRETLAAEIPSVLRGRASASFVVAPASHRLRSSVWLRRLLARLQRR